MKNIAIIPARSGSKGLRDKNIKELAGVPLMAYSIRAAIESKLFDEIMVSTDSERYRVVATKFGAHVPFLRSQAMSSDTAGSWDVVKEVLSSYCNLGMTFDTVCLLQPTSPLRSAEDIIRSYCVMEEKQAQAVTAVCKMDHSPLWAMCLDGSLSLKQYREDSKNKDLPRQQLPTYYRINGAIYLRKIQYIGSQIELLDKEEYAYIMETRRSIDIDTLEDFEMAEFFLNKTANK